MDGGPAEGIAEGVSAETDMDAGSAARAANQSGRGQGHRRGRSRGTGASNSRRGSRGGGRSGIPRSGPNAPGGVRKPGLRGPGGVTSGVVSLSGLAPDTMLPGAKRRMRWNELQDDALLRLVGHLGSNWPLVWEAWQKAGLDNDAGPDAPERSTAAMRQRYYLLMGRRPGKKAPPRGKNLHRWEVQDDLDLLEAIDAGGEGFGPTGTVDSACASLSRTLNARPHCPVRTDMSVYNRVRRLSMRKNMTIYDFLGLPEAAYAGALQVQAESELNGGGEDDDGNDNEATDGDAAQEEHEEDAGDGAIERVVGHENEEARNDGAGAGEGAATDP
jgi:hypothetical protein